MTVMTVSLSGAELPAVAPAVRAAPVTPAVPELKSLPAEPQMSLPKPVIATKPDRRIAKKAPVLAQPAHPAAPAQVVTAPAAGPHVAAAPAPGLAATPSAAKAASEPIEVFSNKATFVEPPGQPRYPLQAKRRNQQGVVTVEVRLDAQGQQRSITVASSSGVESLDQAALEAVATWRFRPAVVAGTPVPSRVLLPIQFVLMANR